jgi:hypothetical protein
MNRAVAEQLMTEFLALGGPINRATELTEKIEDADERKAVRRAIGEIAVNVYSNLMRPIVQKHPDLDPDAKGSKD